MTISLPSLRAHLGELLAALDEEIRLLDLRRSQLEALSVAIVARDDARMEALLQQTQATAQMQADVDERLERTRRALAVGLGCPPDEMKLQRLTEMLHGRERAELESRRRRIVELAQRLRQQHLQTSVLLSECARINRLLLEALFPQSKGVDTYSNGGQERWWPETGVVNAER